MEEYASSSRRSAPTLPGIGCRKVLCWVNSVAEADRVVLVGMALSEAVGGHCEVVLCLDAPCRSGLCCELGVERDAPLTPEVISRAEARLARLYGDALPTLVLPGQPVTEIRRYARHKEIELIVMGEQCLNLQRQTGQWLCDDAPCAVLSIVLPPEEQPRRHPALPRTMQRRGVA
jgi:nucleotide-binding universal stress UspA family protein